MFDIGFSEILFIAALAIVVLGPERLPELARRVGTLVRAWRNAKNDFQMRLNEAVLKDAPPSRQESVNDPSGGKGDAAKEGA